jgi:replicative superfamily II helicase
MEARVSFEASLYVPETSSSGVGNKDSTGGSLDEEQEIFERDESKLVFQRNSNFTPEGQASREDQATGLRGQRSLADVEILLQNSPEYRALCTASIQQNLAQTVPEAEKGQGSSMFHSLTETREWDEVIIAKPESENRGEVPTSGFPHVDLPGYMKPGFQHISQLNNLQCRILDRALRTRGNVLICAPTGSGKTEVAVALVLQSLFEECNGNLQEFKCVYIAPMRALVSELQRSLSARLRHYGILVSECTGEHRLSHRELWRSHIIVSTPEKWDIITRHADERPLFRFLKIVIIDEIHILGDPKRGPVLERCVARMHHETALFGSRMRLVGLSATLPNYEDVAVFLRAKLNEAVFTFPDEERPCPLDVRIIALKHRVGLLSKARLDQIMNQATWVQVRKFGIEKQEQILIFVHERNDTMKTARWLLNAADVEHLSFSSRFCPESMDTPLAEQLNERKDLLSLLLKGIGIHHAGLTREIRQVIEAAFLRGELSVLISTATLAWGVNLPANVVIIKGTQFFSAEEGQYIQLSSLNVQQMLGRAGRYPFHRRGTGVIITTQSEAQSYASIVSHKVLIESHHIPHLGDSLLAEVAGGSVNSLEEAAEWLKYTFLFIRALRGKRVYGLPGLDGSDGEKALEGFRLQLCHSAARELARHGLIEYTEDLEMSVTARGRVASTYMLSYDSITPMVTSLRSASGFPDIFHALAISTAELRNLSIPRGTEGKELQRLLQQVPVPLIDSEHDLRISVLLQAYISQTELKTSASLLQETSVLVENAVRILRALHELAVLVGLAIPMRYCLLLAKCLHHRRWIICREMEADIPVPQACDPVRKPSSDFPKSAIHRDSSPSVFCQALGRIKPRSDSWITLESSLLPVSGDLLRVECILRMIREQSIRDGEALWISLEDASGEYILFSKRSVPKDGTCQLAAVCQVPFAARTALAFWRVSAEESAIEDFIQAECLRDLPCPHQDSLFEREAITFKVRDVEHIRAAFETLLPRNFLLATDDRRMKRPGLMLSVPVSCNRTVLLSTSLKDIGNEKTLCYVSPHAWHQFQFARLIRSLHGSVWELCDDIHVNEYFMQTLADRDGLRALIGSPRQYESLTRLAQLKDFCSSSFLWLFDDIESISWEAHYEFLLMKLEKAQQILVSEILGNVGLAGRWLGIDASKIFQFEMDEEEKRPLCLVNAANRLISQPGLVAKSFWRHFFRRAPVSGHTAICCVMRGSASIAVELARQSPFRFRPTDDANEVLPGIVSVCLERGVLLFSKQVFDMMDFIKKYPWHVVVVQQEDLLLCPCRGTYSLAFAIGNALDDSPKREKENHFRWCSRYLSRLCSGNVFVLLPENGCNQPRDSKGDDRSMDSVADRSWSLLLATQLAQGHIKSDEDIVALVGRTYYSHRYLYRTENDSAHDVSHLKSDIERIAVIARLLANRSLENAVAIRSMEDHFFSYRALAPAFLSSAFGVCLQTSKILHNSIFEEASTEDALLEMLSELLLVEGDGTDMLSDFTLRDLNALFRSIGEGSGPSAKTNREHVLCVRVVRGLLKYYVRHPSTAENQLWFRHFLEAYRAPWFRVLPAMIFVTVARLPWSKFREILAVVRKLSSVFTSTPEYRLLENAIQHPQCDIVCRKTDPCDDSKSFVTSTDDAPQTAWSAWKQSVLTRVFLGRSYSICAVRAISCPGDDSLRLTVSCSVRPIKQRTGALASAPEFSVWPCWIVALHAESYAVVGAKRFLLQHGNQEATLELFHVAPQYLSCLHIYIFDEIYADGDAEYGTFVFEHEISADPRI